MRIALASPPVARSLDEGLAHVHRFVEDAAAQNARIVAFPEAYLPGLRGVGADVPPYDATDQALVVEAVAALARDAGLAIVLGMEWLTNAGRHIGAAVFGADGTRLGVQLKTQLDPTEEAHYAPGWTRQVFAIGGLRFGVAICHEGFRYPETVRWAAARGAQVVFHPHWTGGDTEGPVRTVWGEADAPYYERAVMCRALENTIYLASINVGVRFPESATAVLDPEGRCLAHAPYGEPSVLVCDLELGRATGHLASRYAPERYPGSRVLASPQKVPRET